MPPAYGRETRVFPQKCLCLLKGIILSHEEELPYRDPTLALMEAPCRMLRSSSLYPDTIESEHFYG